MKRLIPYILVLVLLLALVGCNITPNRQNETTPLEEQTSPQFKEIRDIVDLTKTQDIPTDDALEFFYSDEWYDYAFSGIKSSYVMVYYKDGTEENVKVALEAGNITIKDLDGFHIQYLEIARETSKRLTLPMLKELIATHGESLTWGHFDGYYFIETGSGLYIRIYPVEEEYELWIGGEDPSSKPMYIYFMETDVKDGEETHPIDVRYESIDSLLDPADLAQAVIDYEDMRKAELNALREKYPYRTYFYHAVDRVECVYALNREASAEAIVEMYNMKNEFATAKVSALEGIKMISIVFERNDFTESMHQKLKEIKEKEACITNLWVDMQSDIAQSYQAKIEYYTDHAVPLGHLVLDNIYHSLDGKDVIIRSKAEYNAYLDNFLKEEKSDYLTEIITKQKELYTETFFEKNALIVTKVFTLSSGSITVTVENLYISDNKVYVALKTEIPGIGTADIQYAWFTVKVPQNKVVDVTEIITVK